VGETLAGNKYNHQKSLFMCLFNKSFSLANCNGRVFSSV